MAATGTCEQGSEQSSVAWVFGPRYVRAFTEGDCWHLALELRRLTGLPLLFLNPADDDPDYWEHVGLELPDGRVLDVEGVHLQAAWLERWCRGQPTGGGHVIRAETDDQVALLVSDVDRIFGWSRVRAVARHLVDNHVPDLAAAA